MHRRSINNHPQFNKIFEFQSQEWKLPQTVFASPCFEIQELQYMKQELNLVKSKLSQFDLTEWSLHTQRRNLAGYVFSHLKKQVRPELLTQAWCKFYEIVDRFPLLEPNSKSIKSLHLCEAPGAFVCALNHYLVSHFPGVDWKWQANTLNPYYEGNNQSHMIADDRLISHTLDHWLFGLDLTGNLLDHCNHEQIVNKVNSCGKVNLVTADGSINCMCDPGEQERLVDYLHYCETLTALSVLDKDGSFVLKIFTVFESSTLCLLYLLNCVFTKTILFKPCTSKSGNSELYFICLGYSGPDSLNSIWNSLILPYKNGLFDRNLSMFSLDAIPENFISQVKSACSYFFLEKQVSAINDNIHFYWNTHEGEEHSLHNTKINIANLYIKTYRIRPTKKKFRIVPYLDICRNTNSEFHKTVQKVCFKDWDFSDCINVAWGKKIRCVNTSTFVTPKYLDMLSDYLSTKKKIPSNNGNCLYNTILDAISDSTTVINGNSFHLTPYYQYQKELFQSLIKAIEHRKHIFLINLPIHTNFLAALWCIIASLFKIVFCGPGFCLFHTCIEPKFNHVNSILEEIKSIYDNCSSHMFNSDLIYIFKPNLFCSNLSHVAQILRLYNMYQFFPVDKYNN